MNVSDLVLATAFQGEDAEDTRLLISMYEDARGWLKMQTWCKEVFEGYVGLGVGGVIGVFLFRILPAEVDLDEHVWVIRGDVPPAFLEAHELPTARAALEEYIHAMLLWAKAVEDGRSTDNLIPVNAPATRANARDLAKRMRFIETVILGNG